ncbi:MAG: anhydro-N-acetylmuramic acid kinase [Candidatus Sericytochromatia bacterium]
MLFPLRVLGLMSGTSLDGLDLGLFCLDSLNPLRFAQEAFETKPMPAELEAAIRHNLEPGSSQVDLLCALDMQLAQWLAASSLAFLAEQGLTPADVDLIGSHGQTLYHIPPGQPLTANSLQLGNGSALAALTGLTTVSDFRPADMALGGQGAPLVPFLDQLLFGAPGQSRVLQNIGGMANLTWLGPEGEIQAFDTGPGNALIDGLAQRLTGQPRDTDGALALQGRVDAALLAQWLSLDYFQQAPPRSTGRELFGEAWLDAAVLAIQARALSVPDALATVTALTVQSIAQACRDWLPVPPDALFVSGGGVHNRAVMQGLAQALAPARVSSLQDMGCDPDAKEALAFAVLAATTLLGQGNNVPAITGAAAGLPLGQIAPGRNWLSLLQRLLPALTPPKKV